MKEVIVRNVALAASPLRDVLRPRSAGEPVNTHVVEQVLEPQPDFEAMQRTIEQPLTAPSLKPIRDDDGAR